MSEFSEDFMLGVGDLMGAFGESVVVLGPAGAGGTVDALVSAEPSEVGQGREGKRDQVFKKKFEFDGEAVTGGPPAIGWTVTHGGVGYVVMKAHVGEGGLVCCEGVARGNTSVVGQ